MTRSDQLLAAISAFKNWRNNRNGRQAQTPTPLREQAVSLLDTHSARQITSALNISGSQLKQWRNSLEPVENIPQFIDVSLVSSSVQAAPDVELCFANGGQLRLRGGVSQDTVITIITAMKS